MARFSKLFFLRSTKGLVRTDRFLLWIIYLVPLGKLVYFNIPGLSGFKFSFLIWSITCLFICGFWLAGLKRSSYQRFMVFFVFLLFPILSLIFRGNFDELLYYSGDEQNDSLGARLAALIFLMMFSTAVFDLCCRHGLEVVMRAFVDGVTTATLVGCVIFALVFAGVIGVLDLEPISADTHIVDNIYRFNPGGNVNEFGLIAIYALFMLKIAYPAVSRIKLFATSGLFLFALFFSLTRAAWLSYAGALVAMAVVSGRGRKLLFYAVLSFAVMIFIVYNINDEFANIVVSRLAFEGGASGDDRLDKVDAAFFTNNVSILQLFFGHGWATNLYMHSVPLQLIYEIGIAGYMLASIAMALAIFKLIIRSRREVPGALSLFGCLIAFCIDSVLHHTLYHMQTWFIIGLILYVGFSPRSMVRLGKSDCGQ